MSRRQRKYEYERDNKRGESLGSIAEVTSGK